MSRNKMKKTTKTQRAKEKQLMIKQSDVKISADHKEFDFLQPSRLHHQPHSRCHNVFGSELVFCDDRTAIVCFRFIHDDSETTEDDVDLKVTDGLNSADVVLLIQASLLLTSSVNTYWILLMDQYFTSTSIPSSGSADER